MAQRSKGFVRLEWTCPNCSTRNPGPQKTCSSCGSPQPENVKFEVGADQGFVKDEAEIKRAQAGADIHCGYCGARNPGDAATCVQCGADLKEGKRRESGAELSPAQAAKEITCKTCGQVNPAANFKCANCGAPLPKAATPPVVMNTPSAAASAASDGASSKPAMSKKTMIIGAIIGFVLLCCCGIGILLLLMPAGSVTGTVTDVYWQTIVPVQEQQEVHYSDESSAPSDAYNVDCDTTDREVCTERTIDKGNGYAEVVEECHTESETSCSYDIMEWQNVREETLSGDDLNPVYAQPSYTSDQRLGESSLTMKVTFSTENGNEEYTPSSLSEFQMFTLGSQWDLSMNVLGGILSVSPR